MHRNAFIYVAIVLGALAIALDFASVDLALPALEAQFGLDLDGVQWVINGYVLAFAVLMVAGGKFADAYGRKRVFLLGMGLFALASLLGGFAWSGGSVIAFRVLQGVGAAMLWPAMIGMACGAVGDQNRGFVLGLIFGSCSLGNAAGPLVGGALTEWSWRWVLWVNVPMAALAMLATIWKVPDNTPVGTHPRNDYAGMIALTGGLVSLMVVVYQGNGWGWTSPATLTLTALAIGLLGIFPWIEARVPEPLVPPDIMRSREMLTLCCCAFVICQLFFIVLLYFTQYGMKFLGEDPLRAGARVVQFMLTYGVVSYFGGPLIKWLGTRNLLLVGMVSATVASVMLGFTGPGAGPVALNGWLMLLGVGVGAVIPTVSARAIESAGTARAGLVSGVTFMCQLSGSALMLAVNTALFTAVAMNHIKEAVGREGVELDEGQVSAVADVLGGARSVHQLPTTTVADVPDITDLVTQAYVSGLQAALWLSAALVALVLIMVICFVPARPAVSDTKPA